MWPLMSVPDSGNSALRMARAAFWWEQAGAALERTDNLTVVNLPGAATRALATLAQRTMQLTCTIQDGQIWMADPQQSVAIEPAILKSPPAAA